MKQILNYLILFIIILNSGCGKQAFFSSRKRPVRLSPSPLAPPISSNSSFMSNTQVYSLNTIPFLSLAKYMRNMPIATNAQTLTLIHTPSYMPPANINTTNIKSEIGSNMVTDIKPSIIRTPSYTYPANTNTFNSIDIKSEIGSEYLYKYTTVNYPYTFLHLSSQYKYIQCYRYKIIRDKPRYLYKYTQRYRYKIKNKLYTFKYRTIRYPHPLYTSSQYKYIQCYRYKIIRDKPRYLYKYTQRYRYKIKNKLYTFKYRTIRYPHPLYTSSQYKYIQCYRYKIIRDKPRYLYKYTQRYRYKIKKQTIYLQI